MQLAFNVNGQAERVEADPRETLLAVLRDRLGLVGSKYGCGEGECGACTVLINGRPVTSCMTLAGQVNAQDVMTIEGMPEDPVGMHVVQAFAEAGSVQCGFCTPGFVLATRHLLQHNPEPDREAVRTALSGNLCRCTGYTKIVDAGIAASRSLAGQRAGDTTPPTSGGFRDECFLRPDTLDEALALLAEDPDLRPLCGSTDISVRFEHHLKDHRYLDLTGVPELSYVRETPDAISIGAATPYTDIIEAPAIRQRAPILVSASREVGGVQIQNLGTLGGNLANASPSADGVPALVALGAVVVISSRDGRRQVLAEAFATGPGRNVLEAGEMITEIVIPISAASAEKATVSFFEKLGPRQTQTIAIASVALRASRDGDRLQAVRVALGAVAPTIVRAPQTEALLAAGPLDEARVIEAAEILQRECTPIDDIRGSAAYRKQLVRGLLIRGLWPHVAAADGGG